MLRPTLLLLMLLLQACSLSADTVENGAEKDGIQDTADDISAELIAAMGPMPPSPSQVAAPSPPGHRQGRQFGRRLSSQLQSQLSLRGPLRTPVYSRSPSVVSVSAPTPAAPAPAPAPAPPAPPPASAVALPPALPPGLSQSIPVSAPVGPPGTVNSAVVFASQAGLPSPPAPPSPPPPPPPTVGPVAPPGDGAVQATNIRCLQSSSREQLTASLVSARPLVAPPVLTLRPAVNPLSSAVCAVTSSQDGRRLELAVTNLEACGVESCVQPSGERWLCLTMRFPLIAGLHLPEDDVIQIQCRPQDPSQTAGKQLIVQATGFESLSPVLFSGGRQEFECEIALFRRTPGSDMFSTVVTAGDTITLGEELHLRSIIRSGDGWQFSKLTDVLVERVAADGGTSLPSDSVPLVFSDGCRNQDLTLVAPDHPARHQTNQLISNFAFRVFTFQGMTSGDRLQISARVTGCVEAIDCAPTACPAGGQGFGRRRRRDAHLESSNTTDWRQNLAFSVVIPDTRHVLSRRREPASAAPPDSPANTAAAAGGGCPASLLASLIAALAGCLLLLTSAVCLLNARQRRRLRAASRQPLPAPPPQQRCGGQLPHHECTAPPVDGYVDVGWPAGGPRHWPLEGAITAPRGRCTERRLKRRRADIRRSFSAGTLRCECAEREGREERGKEARQNGKVNVSIVRVPAQENIYSEPKPRWDVAPTMV